MAQPPPPCRKKLLLRRVNNILLWMLLLLDTVRADEKYSSITCTRDTTATSGNTRNRFNGGDDIVSCCLGFFSVNYELKSNVWLTHCDSILLTGRKLVFALLLGPIWFVKTKQKTGFRTETVSDLAVLCVWFANLKLVSQNHRNLLGRWFRHPNQIWNCSCLCWLPWM